MTDRLVRPLLDLPEASALDCPAWMSLAGPHSAFAERHGQAVRYPGELAPYAALAPEGDPAPGRGAMAAWEDLAGLVGPGGIAALPGIEEDPPAGWEVVSVVHAVQLVGPQVQPVEDPEAIRLGPEDVPEMLALVAATRPGPFAPRTIELGTYLGFRRRGALIAMAGERLHPEGWTEISAVCTAADCRGQGLATRLVLALAAEIRGRGEVPFLHASAANTEAIHLYEKLGFTIRRPMPFQRVRAPA